MQLSVTISRWLKDIRFWILLFALLRLYGITNPPVEVAHSWRQTTVAMTARNFLEVDPDILYPRIDIGGDLSGITGMEFPLFNYLIFLMCRLFGFAHWYGRLINLVVSSLGCLFFYKLLRRFFAHRVAFCSTFILLVSLWFSYSRKIMPDTFSLSLVIMGMYFGMQYLTRPRHSLLPLLLYALFSLAGVLSKLPSGYLLVLFAIPFFSHSVATKRKVWFAVLSLLICIPVGLWYFFWVPQLVSRYGLEHFFMGKGIAEGARELAANLPLTLKHFYDYALKYIGFALFAAGLIYAFLRKEWKLLAITGLSLLAFAAVMLKAGWTFAHHVYYILPFVPVMSLVAGFAVASVHKKWLFTLLLAAVALENILNQHSDFIIRPDRQAIVQLEQVMDTLSQPSDLIVVNSGEDPTPVYFAHRKGWVAYNNQLAVPAYLQSLANHGCRYVIILKQVFGTDINLPLTPLFSDPNYTVYALNTP